MHENLKYEAVIGLEVHAQLSTVSKLFCGDSTVFGAAANTQVSAISLAHPGTLPVMNEKVIELAVKLGLAFDCTIVQNNYFARKNYFYPDLPKGYQVSQHTAPVCIGGFVPIVLADGREKNIELNRIHMEEDAGKSLHDIDDNYTCIDLNRAGMPLLEIVTEPCLHSAEEAFAYLTSLRKNLRWLEVCDGNMEEGSMRCDANVSVRPIGDKNLYTRVEVKNLNSIRNVKKAIEIEVARLIKLTEQGENIKQETRSFNADNNTTFSLRTKEEADDYRYFPEPDLPPFFISNEYMEQVKNSMPMLPAQLQKEFIEKYSLSNYDASFLTSDKELADLFEELNATVKSPKSVANWLTGPIKNYCDEQAISFKEFTLNKERLTDLIHFSNTGKVNFNTASTKIMLAMIDEADLTAENVATKLNLLQEDDTDALQQWIDEALAAMPDKVKEYKSGKKGLIGLFAGAVKKQSKGKADMQIVNTILLEKLNNS